MKTIYFLFSLCLLAPVAAKCQTASNTICGIFVYYDDNGYRIKRAYECNQAGVSTVSAKEHIKPQEDFSQSFLKGALSSFSGASAGCEFGQGFKAIIANDSDPEGVNDLFGLKPGAADGDMGIGFREFLNGGVDGVQYTIGSHTLNFFAYQGGLNALNGYATNQYNFTDQQDLYGLNVLFSFAGGAVGVSDC